ncbi:unnamed protein product, partial [Brassica rapa subsp. narinosa]
SLSCIDKFQYLIKFDGRFRSFKNKTIHKIEDTLFVFVFRSDQSGPSIIRVDSDHPIWYSVRHCCCRGVNVK